MPKYKNALSRDALTTKSDPFGFAWLMGIRLYLVLSNCGI